MAMSSLKETSTTESYGQGSSEGLSSRQQLPVHEYYCYDIAKMACSYLELWLCLVAQLNLNVTIVIK